MWSALDSSYELHVVRCERESARDLLGLGVAVAAILVVDPRLIPIVLPLAIVLVCPLSCLVMMKGDELRADRGRGPQPLLTRDLHRPRGAGLHPRRPQAPGTNRRFVSVIALRALTSPFRPHLSPLLHLSGLCGLYPQMRRKGSVIESAPGGEGGAEESHPPNPTRRTAIAYRSTIQPPGAIQAGMPWCDLRRRDVRVHTVQAAPAPTP